MGAFGKGRNSIQAQLSGGQLLEDSIKLKRDREYIRRIIKDSKSPSRVSSINGDIELSPKEETKLKWNRQENRFTHKTENVREGPSKDHDEAVYFLEVQRLQKERELGGNSETKAAYQVNNSELSHISEHVPQLQPQVKLNYENGKLVSSEPITQQKYGNFDIIEQPESIAERTSTEGHLTQQLQQMDTGMRASSLNKKQDAQQNESFNLPSDGSSRQNEKKDNNRSISGAAIAVPPASSPVERAADGAIDEPPLNTAGVDTVDYGVDALEKQPLDTLGGDALNNDDVDFNLAMAVPPLKTLGDEAALEEPPLKTSSVDQVKDGVDLNETGQNPGDGDTYNDDAFEQPIETINDREIPTIS